MNNNLTDEILTSPEHVEKSEEGAVKRLSRHVANLTKNLTECEKSLIIVLEGYDASGKSGCAKRIVRFMDPDMFDVIHISAPTADERRYNYMKRFWDDIPASGKIAVFDRSWYGRVLVERIDSFCTEEEWRRAYSEINNFEKFLTDNGAILLKFWLEVSEEVQLQRFCERAEDPTKRHKITNDDWHNRSKRRLYEAAASEMLKETDTSYARWHVIPSNNKKASRTAVLKTIIEAVGEV